MFNLDVLRKMRPDSRKRNHQSGCCKERFRSNSIFLIFTLFFFVTSPLANSSNVYEIKVLKSNNAKPYDLFLKGFRETVPTARISVLDMRNDINRGVEKLKNIQKEKPGLILALGAKAAWVTRDMKDTRVIFSMVTDPEKYQLGRMAGVKLDIPAVTYLRQMKKILPHAKRVGFIYSSDSLAKEVLLAAKETGATIVPEKIPSLEEIKGAMDRLSSKVEVFLLLRDPVIMSSSRAVKEFIILRALRAGTPVIGFNKWLVKQGGALFCLFSDYGDIGRQTGRYINRINDETDLVIESPEDLKVFMNRNVLERLSQRIQLKIPNNAYFSD